MAAATQFLIREVKQLRDEKEIAARSGGRGGGLIISDEEFDSGRDIVLKIRSREEVRDS